MTTSELVGYFVDKVQSGEITFDKVRPELVQRGIAENDIKTIVRQVDEELQNQVLSGSSSYNQLVVVGIAVTLVGIVITVASYTGLFSSTSSYVIVIAYGPVLAGIAMIFAGLRRGKRKGQKKFGSRMRDRLE